jgi:hypothetical protein
MDWMISHNLGVGVVQITGTHLKWESPETDEERKRREEWELRQEARTEEWERQELTRLKAKYEGDQR